MCLYTCLYNFPCLPIGCIHGQRKLLSVSRLTYLKLHMHGRGCMWHKAMQIRYRLLRDMPLLANQVMLVYFRFEYLTIPDQLGMCYTKKKVFAQKKQSFALSGTCKGEWLKGQMNSDMSEFWDRSVGSNNNCTQSCAWTVTALEKLDSCSAKHNTLSCLQNKKKWLIGCFWVDLSPGRKQYGGIILGVCANKAR